MKHEASMGVFFIFGFKNLDVSGSNIFAFMVYFFENLNFKQNYNSF